MKAAAIVTGRFRKLSEFVLANQEKAPAHRLVVLEDNFEFSNPADLDRSARTALTALFGEAKS